MTNMAFEAENVKNATHIKLYCHLTGYMDGDLKPIPIDKEISNITEATFDDIYATNFLEYNKITLADKDQQFTVPNSILAYKIPEYSFIKDLGFAFKAFLPPHLEKIEFIKRESGQEDVVLYTKHFSIYNEENILVEADNTYSKWFIYSIAQKIILDDGEIPEETFCFEYELHTADTIAHFKDVVALPMELDNHSLGTQDSIYYALYTTEQTDSNIKAQAQVVNGNLITNEYRLFYLGNNIYDNTDEVNKVIDWADGQYNNTEEPIIEPSDITAEFVSGSLNTGYIDFFSELEGAHIPWSPFPDATAEFAGGSLNAGYIVFFSALADPYIPPEPPSSPNYLSGVMFASDTTIGTNNKLVLGNIMGQSEEPTEPVMGTMDETSETLVNIIFGTME